MRRLCPAKSASHGTLPQLHPLGAGKGASSMVAAGGKPNGLTGVSVWSATVGSGLGVGVADAVAVAVTVGVWVRVGVAVRVLVALGVSVNVGETVAVAV